MEQIVVHQSSKIFFIGTDAQHFVPSGRNFILQYAVLKLNYNELHKGLTKTNGKISIFLFLKYAAGKI